MRSVHTRARPASEIGSVVEADLLQQAGEVGGQSRVLLVEVLHCVADRLAEEYAPESVLEWQELPLASRHERVAPGTVDVADDRQRPALRMGEEALRQCADERLRSQLRRWLAGHVREGVLLGRAGSEAGEEERNEPVDAGIRGDVGGAEVVGLAYLADARPVLAEQRTVPRALVGMAGWPATHPVGRGEEQRRAA